ncbi:MAG: septal ring lytic transglycosylase RlpA family protein [Cyanobacteria bacterium J06635_15]
MKQKFLGSLTAAVMVSAFGAPLSGSAQQTDDVNPLPPAGESASWGNAEPVDGGSGSVASAVDAGMGNAIASAMPDVRGPEVREGSASTHLLDAVEDSDVPSGSAVEARILPLEPTVVMPVPFEASVVQVQAHPFDSQQAATLYVRDIPVLTFVGQSLAASSDLTIVSARTVNAVDADQPDVEVDDVNLDPVIRATAIAARINQLTQDSFDSSTIQVRWDDEQEAYLIEASETLLVTVGESAILPDTTGEPAQDALQAANRLRRLLGNEPPLTEIIDQPEPEVPALLVRASMSGNASWYGPGFHGRRSASGEVFNQNAMTAAHRTLPFGTQVRVTNLATNQQVVVRINDRGPYSHGRIIDLSAGAARQIGLMNMGVGPVRVEVLEMP